MYDKRLKSMEEAGGTAGNSRDFVIPGGPPQPPPPHINNNDDSLMTASAVYTLSEYCVQ